MGAPKGNQFWKARSSHGRDPIFKDKELLWEACTEYFEWIHNNPLGKAIVYQGEVSEKPEDLMRAMTIAGLCIFIDISQDTWENYRDRDDFVGVTKRVDAIIYEQKFTGAAAGLLNPNIIARDLGLTDKQQTELTGANGSDFAIKVIYD